MSKKPSPQEVQALLAQLMSQMKSAAGSVKEATGNLDRALPQSLTDLGARAVLSQVLLEATVAMEGNLLAELYTSVRNHQDLPYNIFEEGRDETLRRYAVLAWQRLCSRIPDKDKPNVKEMIDGIESLAGSYVSAKYNSFFLPSISEDQATFDRQMISLVTALIPYMKDKK